MKKQTNINGIPALVIGEDSPNVLLYLHGKLGYKEEAERIADIANAAGYQVLSIDFPEHGERKDETHGFDPWHVVPELRAVMEQLKKHYAGVSLMANSIGAWFAMQSFSANDLDQCLFVSPVLDMENLIRNMMVWANVTEDRLKQEQSIPTEFGETLSWDYLQYACQHPIWKWDTPTYILYGEHDQMTERDTVDAFCMRHKANLTVMEQGEHWFHTEEQMQYLRTWLKSAIE